MKQLLALAILLVTLAGFATAGTLTGTLAYPNTAITLNNATLSFTLSQPAYVPGSFAVAPQTVSCYTSNAGQVVGLPDPLVAPAVSDTGGASPGLAAGTYYVQFTYYIQGGAETLASPESSVSISSGHGILLTLPALQPANATGVRIYVGTTSGGETFNQASPFANGNPVVGVLLSSQPVPPASNNSACSLRFADEMIPSGTWYTTTLVTSTGSTIPGFPQRWQMWGGSAATISLSNGFPTSFQLTVFPTPIQSNPPNSAAQSINSALTINGLLTLNAGLASSSNFVNPSLSHPTVVAGLANNGSGLQHKRVSTCTTAAGANSTCITTVTWNTAFADANYTATCSWFPTTTAGSFFDHISTQTASAMNVEVSNGPAGGATTGTIECIAIHD